MEKFLREKESIKSAPWQPGTESKEGVPGLGDANK